MLKRYSILILASSVAIASDKLTIHTGHLMASSRKNQVTFDKKGFAVNGKRIQDYDLDESLRYVTSKEDLEDVFSNKRITRKILVSRIGNDYGLRTHDSLSGKGPILGAILGWTVRTVCYGVATMCVNKASKTVISGANYAIDRSGAPKGTTDVMVTGFAQLAPAGPAYLNTPSVTIAATAGDAVGQHHYPEAHAAICDAAVVGTAAYVAQTGSIPAIEALATAAQIWGTSLPTP